MGRSRENFLWLRQNLVDFARIVQIRHTSSFPYSSFGIPQKPMACDADGYENTSQRHPYCFARRSARDFAQRKTGENENQEQDVGNN
jgi:hypothetical protein